MIGLTMCGSGAHHFRRTLENVISNEVHIRINVSTRVNKEVVLLLIQKSVHADIVYKISML